MYCTVCCLGGGVGDGKYHEMEEGGEVPHLLSADKFV